MHAVVSLHSAESVYLIVTKRGEEEQLKWYHSAGLAYLIYPTCVGAISVLGGEEGQLQLQWYQWVWSGQLYILLV